MKEALVSEIFESIQGEYSGPSFCCPAVFVRFSGCNLKCNRKYKCDSMYALKLGTRMSTSALIDQVGKSGLYHKVYTGGEPLLQQEIIEAIVSHFSGDNHYHTVETNGTIKPSLYLLPKVFWSVSPKLSNMEDTARSIVPKVLQIFNSVENSLFKFVVGDQADLDEVLSLVDALGLKQEKIVLMPEGTSGGRLREVSLWLTEECIRYDFKFSPRIHIYLWENKRGR